MEANRKKVRYFKDTHRALLAADIHACNECGAWETKCETWRQEVPIIHKNTCSFYPSLTNIIHEANLANRSQV